MNGYKVAASDASMHEKTYAAEVCNICGSGRFRRIHYFKEWTLGRDPVRDVSIVRCRECGVRRRMPGITDEYEADYHAPYIDQGQAIHPHGLSHLADLMMARLRQFNQRNVTFLDVGCSTGRELRLAQAMGFAVTGLDYSKWAAELCARLGFETRHGSLLGQWEKAEVFDVIHCSHTIEHVPDPVAYLREMHRLVKSGGQLMMAFPNYASFPRWVLREKWGPWCLDSHLWQFTAAQMCRLLRQQGFTIFTCRTLHGYTPDSRFKRRVLDLAASMGAGDGCNIVAVKP
jgi:2-polyprenyl-3-methyl-5-hydroxy-6-metoxy-1,4-benzoquinol methylase